MTKKWKMVTSGLLAVLSLGLISCERKQKTPDTIPMGTVTRSVNTFEPAINWRAIENGDEAQRLMRKEREQNSRAIDTGTVNSKTDDKTGDTKIETPILIITDGTKISKSLSVAFDTYSTSDEWVEERHRLLQEQLTAQQYLTPKNNTLE